MIKIGDKWRGKKIRDVVELSNGWFILKTDNTKSPQDFKVRTVISIKPRHSLTPKHAHFAIDFYGKICRNKKAAWEVFKAINEVWHGNNIMQVISKYKSQTQDLPGYNLEYILYALNWILEQEDLNFQGRPHDRQRQLDELCKKLEISIPQNRKGSQLAISLLCNIAIGTHPVEAFLAANLDVKPLFSR